MESDVPLWNWELDHLAEIQVARILQYLSASPDGTDAAIRFNTAFDEALDEECRIVAEQVTDTGKPWKRIHEPASVYRARPLFRLSVQTAKKRARRSSIGLWYAYYSIDDANRDGKPNRITVKEVHHSGSEPFAINTGQFDLPDDEGDA